MKEVVVESDERHIQIYRGDSLLSPSLSHSIYYPKEVLKVSLSSTRGDYIFQVENASFINGGCHGLRTCKNQQLITMPSDNIGVKVWAGKMT